MPQVYRRAVEKGPYENIGEIRKEVIRLEIEMTRRLYENSPEDDRTGETV